MVKKTLPGRYFCSSEIYERESEKIFTKQWVCVGRSSQLAFAGDFFLVDLAGEDLIVVRGEDGRAYCHFNVCRHRGTKLEEEACGSFKSRIACPYHAWSYALDGQLKSAPNMQEAAGFCTEDYGLNSVSCAEWQGFVFVNLDASCQALEDAFANFVDRFDSWELASLVPAHRIVYEVSANWKVVFQNYSECYHCSLVHPQLTPITSAKTSSNDFVEGKLLGGPMVLSEQYETVATGGKLCGEVFSDLLESDKRHAYFYTLFPSLFISPHPDYVLTHRIERKSVDCTVITCEWLFPLDVVASSGFDAEPAVDFWDLTNRQDWKVCELTQLGVKSLGYEPGPYSPLESMLAAFDEHYLKELQS